MDAAPPLSNPNYSPLAGAAAPTNTLDTAAATTVVAAMEGPTVTASTAAAPQSTAAPTAVYQHVAPPGLAAQVATALGVDVYVVFVAASTLAAVLLYRLVFRRLLVVGGAAGGGRRRHTTLLIGLPSSGKTTLLEQLVAFDVNSGRVAGLVAETRTSMQVNVEKVLGGQLTVVDYPGHRRLRVGLFEHLREASTVVVVVDAITVHDDRYEGAFALAELLLSVLPSPEFYGVRRLLFVCTKRDDLTSYSAKAVRKLLDKALTASLQSQLGDLASVDVVRDAKGDVVGRCGGASGDSAGARGRAGRKAHVLEIDEDGGFDLEEQLGVPVEFVEVGCDIVGAKPGTESTCRFSVQSVVDFLSAAA